MAPSSAEPSTARVLVIGAGYAGAVCAAALAAANAADVKANANARANATSPPPPPLLAVTLVDPRDHLDSAFTHARALVEPGIADRALLPLDAMAALPPDCVRRVRAAVVGLSCGGDGGSSASGEARLSDGSSVAFDYAVIAAGSSYAFGKSAPAGPATGRQERLAEIEAASRLFFPSPSFSSEEKKEEKKKLRVLVVGGGPLGVEVAAELLTDAPAVGRVTLVHASEALLPALPPRAGALARRWLEQQRSASGGPPCRLALGRRVAAGDPLLLAAAAAMRGQSELPPAAARAGLRVVGGVVVAPEGGAKAALEPRPKTTKAGVDGAPAAGAEAAVEDDSGDDAVPYDLAIVATGILRNTSFLEDGPLASALIGGAGGGGGGGAGGDGAGAQQQQQQRQQRGGGGGAAVRVDASLRVPGFPNVFAAGDVTDVPEEKLAFLASSHGELVAANIVALAKARRAAASSAAADAAADPPPSSPSSSPPPTLLRTWRPSQGLPVCIVTLGRAYAIMCVGPVAAAGWLPTKLKASNLLAFVDKYRKRLGVR